MLTPDLKVKVPDKTVVQQPHSSKYFKLLRSSSHHPEEFQISFKKYNLNINNPSGFVTNSFISHVAAQRLDFRKASHSLVTVWTVYSKIELLFAQAYQQSAVANNRKYHKQFAHTDVHTCEVQHP